MLHQLRHKTRAHLRDFDDDPGSDRIMKKSTCVHIYYAVPVRGPSSNGEAFCSSLDTDVADSRLH